MPIPHDTEHRWWIEVADANPDLANSFRSVLIGLLAFDRNRLARLVGTGFIVAAEPKYALVCSAKHVFTEGVLTAQRPVRGHASSSLFVRAVDRNPSVDPQKLKVVWAPPNTALMLNVIHLNYNDVLDIAGCIVAPQDGESIIERVAIPLDTDVPSAGDVVHMVSMDGIDARELAPPIDYDGKGQQIAISRRISIRVGVVTGVYPRGLRQYRWPAFTTSIPAKPGMSGGFVYWPQSGVTIAACGIVCADNSTKESHEDSFQCGDSVIACAWPALSLRFPLAVPSPPDSPAYTLFEMVRRGFLPPPLGGIQDITVIETGDGNCLIGKVT